MRAHVFNKLKVGQTDRCPCDTGSMTSERLLHHCPTYDALRKSTWSDQTDLRTKLFGKLEELRRTAAFVRATGLDI
jgi:hypothetical protein